MSVRANLLEVQRRFPAGVPLLDPVDDMHIRSEAFLALVARTTTLQSRLADSELQSAPDRDTRYAAYQQKVCVFAVMHAVRARA